MIGIATPIGYVSIKSVSLSWQLSPSSIASPTITLSQNLMWSALVVSRLYVTSVLSFIDKSTFRQLTPCVRTQSPPQSRTSRGPCWLPPSVALSVAYNYVLTSIGRPFDCLSKVIEVTWRHASVAADSLGAVTLTYLFMLTSLCSITLLTVLPPVVVFTVLVHHVHLQSNGRHIAVESCCNRALVVAT